jgi:RHS repeat-associated protein
VRDGTRRYDYDGSGNRVAVRNVSSGLLESLSYVAGRNRLNRRSTPSGQLLKTYYYDGDGAISNDSSAVPGGLADIYYYNGLGEMTGRRWVYDSVYNPIPGYFEPVWAGGANRCRYDALGRRTNGCGGGLVLGFDGDNVVRAEQGGYGYASWRYVQGPGLDDPLVAVHPVGSSQDKYYYLTDGRGRHFAFTDSSGTNFMESAPGSPNHNRYYVEGGNQAGSIENSNGFDNARGASDNTPQLSYYRNRYYDQQTGRFINEDPIGVGGGVNLYQYAGNNPATFTDPFGLRACYEGSDSDVDALRRGTEKATGSRIELDAENCVSKTESNDDRKYDRIRTLFQHLVSSKNTYTLAYSLEDSYYDPHARAAFVLRSDPNHTQYDVCGGGRATFSLGAIIAHELIGHGGSTASELLLFPETWGRKAENWYHAAAGGEQKRCGHDIYR